MVFIGHNVFIFFRFGTFRKMGEKKLSYAVFQKRIFCTLIGYIRTRLGNVFFRPQRIFNSFIGDLHRLSHCFIHSKKEKYKLECIRFYKIERTLYDCSCFTLRYFAESMELPLICAGSERKAGLIVILQRKLHGSV